MSTEPSHPVCIDRTARVFLVWAGILGALGVATGAFGAHALRDRLEPDLFEIWNTGVLYHLLHAPALLGVGLLLQGVGCNRAFVYAGWGFVFGIVVFSGSLYVLALSGVRWFGAITPIGGVSLILGWAALFVGAVRSGSK